MFSRSEVSWNQNIKYLNSTDVVQHFNSEDIIQILWQNLIIADGFTAADIQSLQAAKYYKNQNEFEYESLEFKTCPPGNVFHDPSFMHRY